MVITSLGIDLNVTPILHNHDAPANISDDTVLELNKMSFENKKLREMLTLVSNNYILPNHIIKSMQEHGFPTSNSNKRKLKDHDECNTSETMDDHHHQGSSKRPEFNGVTRVYKWADPFDKSLIVKDGYQWIKYGQKVTKDNPTPRAYFKCSFAPSCPVKKKVQRSVDDANLLVVIYEGEHNHNHQKSMENEHQKHTSNKRCNFPLHGGNFDELVEKMAISLRGNPDFIEELVKAISSKK